MSVSTKLAAESPDRNAAGMMRDQPNALRYDGHQDDPTEIAGLLQSLMPSNVRVLDVGCGTGSVNLVANRGKNNVVVAIEPDDERREVALSRGLEVFGGFLDRAFIEQHQDFDVVMSSDVLEHVASPAALLNLMIEAAKPGGTVLISVPNVAHWSVRLNLLFGRFDYEADGIMDATHLRWFTAKTVQGLVRSTKGELVAMYQTAGSSLPVYQRGLLGLVPVRLRAFAIRRLTRIFPRLFGVQHVLVIRVPG